MPPTRSCQMPCTNTTSSCYNAGKHVLFGWRHESSPPSGISQSYTMRSNSHWFTEICNSQCVSHFAASLIATWAKTFITDACNVTSAVSDILKPWSKKPPAGQVLELGYKYRQLQMQLPIQNPQIRIVNNRWFVQMILPQVHLQKPCYDFCFFFFLNKGVFRIRGFPSYFVNKTTKISRKNRDFENPEKPGILKF